MQSQAQRASEALNDVGLTADGFAGDQEQSFGDPGKLFESAENHFDDNYILSDEEENGQNISPPHSSDERRRSSRPPERAVAASTMAAILVVLLFFVPWRIEPNNKIVWAPFYRSPITSTTTFEESGRTGVTYEEGEIAVGILLLQVLGVVAVGVYRSR